MLVGKTSRQDRGQLLSITFDLSSKVLYEDREYYPNEYFTDIKMPKVSIISINMISTLVFFGLRSLL